MYYINLDYLNRQPDNGIIYPESFCKYLHLANGNVRLEYGTRNALGFPYLAAENKQDLQDFWFVVKTDIIRVSSLLLVSSTPRVTFYDRDKTIIDSIFDQPIHEFCNNGYCY